MNATNDDWSLIRPRWLDIPIGTGPIYTSPTWEVFSENFARHLHQVSAYVSPRVSDRMTLERIVTRVIITSPDLMNRTGDDPVDVARLKTAADLLIAMTKTRGETHEHGISGLQAYDSNRREGMSGKTDEIKGRAKQAAGVLVGDKSLENEGKIDRVAGKIKQTAEGAIDRVKSVIRRKRK
jgi:uncharacterized protein YjbJ (UPF0337 family)